MTWYIAHIIMVVRFKHKRQSRFPIWENLVLIKADSSEEAYEKAEGRGRQEAGDDSGTFRWEGHPAKWVFAGVRKVTLCQDENKRPTDGTEVSYIEMEVRSRESLKKLLNGDRVSVTLDSCFAEEPVGVYEESGESVNLDFLDDLPAENGEVPQNGRKRRAV
jgi:hypothetical protein